MLTQGKRWRWLEECRQEQYKRKIGHFSNYCKDQADSIARILPTLFGVFWDENAFYKLI